MLTFHEQRRTASNLKVLKDLRSRVGFFSIFKVMENDKVVDHKHENLVKRMEDFQEQLLVLLDESKK